MATDPSIITLPTPVSTGPQSLRQAALPWAQSGLPISYEGGRLTSTDKYRATRLRRGYGVPSIKGKVTAHGRSEQAGRRGSFKELRRKDDQQRRDATRNGPGMPLFFIGRRGQWEVGIPDIDCDLPISVSLLLPDRHIFSAIDGGLTAVVGRAHLIGSG